MRFAASWGFVVCEIARGAGLPASVQHVCARTSDECAARRFACCARRGVIGGEQPVLLSCEDWCVGKYPRDRKNVHVCANDENLFSATAANRRRPSGLTGVRMCARPNVDDARRTKVSSLWWHTPYRFAWSVVRWRLRIGANLAARLDSTAIARLLMFADWANRYASVQSFDSGASVDRPCSIDVQSSATTSSSALVRQDAPYALRAAFTVGCVSTHRLPPAPDETMQFDAPSSGTLSLEFQTLKNDSRRGWLMRFRFVAYSVALLISIACTVAWSATARAGQDWPQFRGPEGQGHSDSVGLPLTWSETESVTWKTAIPGQGWSSPVILGDQIWMTSALDSGHSLHAIAVDRKTGQILHDVEVLKVAEPPAVHATNGYASPTPILESGRAYVHFGTMGSACVDTKTGKVLWTNHDFKLDHEVGPGSSPTLYGNLLLFTCDGCDTRYAAALDKTTGQVAWKTQRSGVIDKPPTQHKAFVTPLVIRVGKRDVAIMPGAEWVHAYDPLSGEELWNVKYPGFSNVPRPLYAHGLVYVCTGFNVPELWAIRPEGQGDITDKVVWKATKEMPAKPSPIIVGDEIYTVSDKGIATCMDAMTGQRRWIKRFGGSYTASPIFADGRIYFSSEEGKSIVVAPGKEYQELAANQLDGRFMASPAVSGKALFLRTDTNLYRIEKKDEVAN